MDNCILHAVWSWASRVNASGIVILAPDCAWVINCMDTCMLHAVWVSRVISSGVVILPPDCWTTRVMLVLREWEASLLQIAFQYFTRLLSQVAYIYLFSWLKLCDIARAKFLSHNGRTCPGANSQRLNQALCWALIIQTIVPPTVSETAWLN